MNHWHRHLGVYGICINANRQLLCVSKTRGPYIHRYDLPGGTLEAEEISEGLKREFLEETGYRIKIRHNLGAQDFLIKMPHEGCEALHHIGLFYQVEIDEAFSQNLVKVASDDAGDVLWLSLEELNISNASPLVLFAKEWILQGVRDTQTIVYEKWCVHE